jgi:hypothetical protein
MQYSSFYFNLVAPEILTLKSIEEDEVLIISFARWASSMLSTGS